MHCHRCEKAGDMPASRPQAVTPGMQHVNHIFYATAFGATPTIRRPSPQKVPQNIVSQEYH
jgi:hypothetical protein